MAIVMTKKYKEAVAVAEQQFSEVFWFDGRWVFECCPYYGDDDIPIMVVGGSERLGLTAKHHVVRQRAHYVAALAVRIRTNAPEKRIRRMIRRTTDVTPLEWYEVSGKVRDRIAVMIGKKEAA